MDREAEVTRTSTRLQKQRRSHSVRSSNTRRKPLPLLAIAWWLIRLASCDRPRRWTIHRPATASFKKYQVRSLHLPTVVQRTITTHDHETMSKLLRGVAAGYGAKKLGGGCFSTVIIFIILWWLLG